MKEKTHKCFNKQKCVWGGEVRNAVSINGRGGVCVGPSLGPLPPTNLQTLPRGASFAVRFSKSLISGPPVLRVPEVALRGVRGHGRLRWRP